MEVVILCRINWLSYCFLLVFVTSSNIAAAKLNPSYFGIYSFLPSFCLCHLCRQAQLKFCDNTLCWCCCFEFSVLSWVDLVHFGFFKTMSCSFLWVKIACDLPPKGVGVRKKTLSTNFYMTSRNRFFCPAYWKIAVVFSAWFTNLRVLNINSLLPL